jgi:hypothetical protein
MLKIKIKQILKDLIPIIVMGIMITVGISFFMIQWSEYIKV